jgi:hypothetical protein
MGSLQKRVAATANLLTQLQELDKLRERVKKARKLDIARPKQLKHRPASSHRRAPARRAH